MSEFKYKYELHTHTIEGSSCSRIWAVDLVRYYKDNGYDGIFITDHFTGSSTVPDGTNWENRIKLFCKGYENAKIEGDKIGLKVFFSLEYSYNGTDFLFLGVTPEWLLKNPDLMDLLETNPNELFDRFHAAGGFIVHAHPFMEAHYIDAIRLYPRKVDAVEIINGGKNEFVNGMAEIYANSYNLFKTGGTDCHHDGQKNLTGILCNHECNSPTDIINAIKNGDTRVFSALNGIKPY